MTVAENSGRSKQACNGILTSFPFTMGIADSGDIGVILSDVNETETTLTEGVDYYVSCTNNDCSSGGNVVTTETDGTTPKAYAAGNYIIITFDVPISQESDFTEGMATLYETFEAELDKQTRIMQQLRERIRRCFSVSLTTGATNPYMIPAPLANYLLGWNSAGTNLANFSTQTVTVPQIDYIGNYDDDLDAAVTAIGSDPTTLMIPYAISLGGNSPTTPTTLNLWFTNGGRVNGTGVETLTANGGIIASSWQQIIGNDVTVVGEADLTPQNFGAVGDGVTDDTTAMQRWGTYVSQKTGYTHESFPSGSAYLLSDTTDIDKDDITVLAWGAKFLAGADVPLFDFNPNALADGSVYHDNIWWFGGSFDNGESGTKQGTAFQGHVLSNSGIQYSVFRNFKNVFTGAIKDNFRLQYCRFRNIAKVHYMPDFLTSLVSQNITISNNQLSSSVESYLAYYENTYADVVIEQNGDALGTSAGGLFYGLTAGQGGNSYGLKIENNWPEQGVGISAWVRLDDQGGTLDPLKGFRYANNRSGSSGGLVHLDIDSVSGIVDISGNDFPGAAKKAIVIGNMLSGSTLYIDKNNFAQTASGGGTIWDITALDGAMTFIGQNYYVEDNEGVRTINSNLLIACTDLRPKYNLIASASTITVPLDASSVRISGSADINTITPTWRGHIVNFWFGAGVTATLKDGTANLVLGSDYAGASTIKPLYCDGTSWYPVN